MMYFRRLAALAATALLLPALALAETPAAPTTPAAAKAASAQVAATPELAAFKKAIGARYRLKEKAFAAHDAETIVSKFYSADVISVGEGEGIFVGRDAIRPLYEEVVKHVNVKVDSVYTYVNGDAGWDWADFHVMPLDPKEKPFTFVIVFLWAKVDGEWVCKGDIFLKGNLRSGKLAPAQAPAAEPPAATK